MNCQGKPYLHCSFLRTNICSCKVIFWVEVLHSELSPSDFTGLPSRPLILLFFTASLIPFWARYPFASTFTLLVQLPPSFTPKNLSIRSLPCTKIIGTWTKESLVITMPKQCFSSKIVILQNCLNFYRTQVSLGSGLWVPVYIHPRLCETLLMWLWLMMIPTQYNWWCQFKAIPCNL